jgi:hypothetical protein
MIYIYDQATNQPADVLEVITADHSCSNADAVQLTIRRARRFGEVPPDQVVGTRRCRRHVTTGDHTIS